jgi:hypothetical protein
MHGLTALFTMIAKFAKTTKNMPRNTFASFAGFAIFVP